MKVVIGKFYIPVFISVTQLACQVFAFLCCQKISLHWIFFQWFNTTVLSTYAVSYCFVIVILWTFLKIDIWSLWSIGDIVYVSCIYLLCTSFPVCQRLVSCSLADEVSANIRRTKLLLLKSRERRRFIQLQLRHHGNQSVRRRQSVEDLTLVNAARHSSVSAAIALQALSSPSKQCHSRSSVQRSVLYVVISH